MIRMGMLGLCSLFFRREKGIFGRHLQTVTKSWLCFHPAKYSTRCDKIEEWRGDPEVDRHSGPEENLKTGEIGASTSLDLWDGREMQYCLESLQEVLSIVIDFWPLPNKSFCEISNNTIKTGLGLFDF